MPTSKSRIEVEITLLILQKDIAKVRIAMTDHGMSSACWIEHHFCPLNNITQGAILASNSAPVDTPAIPRYGLKGEASFRVARILRFREKYTLAPIKLLQPTTRQAMPEQLVYRSLRMLFSRAGPQC